jgi:hypothetical protein
MGSTSPAGLPDELVRALAPLRALVHGPRNSVLPIVGSGLSSGALPSWWRLLDDLIGEAEPDLQPELRELLAKDRYLDVASLLEDSAAGKARVLTYMKRTFARPAAPPPSIYTPTSRPCRSITSPRPTTTHGSRTRSPGPAAWRRGCTSRATRPPSPI